MSVYTTVSAEDLDAWLARYALGGLVSHEAIESGIENTNYFVTTGRGRYDGIASIEMFEAVGEAYWPVYFETIRDRLAPGARATIQVITVAEPLFPTYRRTVERR